MNSNELERKIQNIEKAMVTMNEMLSDLKKQQAILIKQESEKQVKINEQHAMKQQQEKIEETVKGSSVPTEKVHKDKKFDLLKLCQIWLPRIFISIMLLGVVWLFKAGVDAGILTPPLRLLFGVLLAGGLYWFGTHQIKAGRASLGLVLLGGSVASIVITTFAAHYLYEYVPAAAAFLLNVLWIVAGIYVAHTHKSEYLAIFVALGGFFVPFLVNSTTPNFNVFLGYETLLTISLLFYAARKLYRILYVAAYVVSQIVLFSFFTFVSSAVINLQIEISVIYTVLQIVLYYQLIRDRNFIFNQRLGFMAYNGVLMVFSFINLDNGSTVLLFAAAIIYFILSYLELKKDKRSLLSAISFALAMFSTAIVISKQFDQDLEMILYLLQGGLAVYVGVVLKNYLKIIIGSIVYCFGVLLTLITPIYDVLSIAFFTHLLLIASFAFLLYKTANVLTGKSKASYQFIFYSFMMLLFIVLTKTGGAVSDEADVNSLTISFLWMLYASASIWYGRIPNTQAIFNKNEIIYVGLVVLFITVGKLFFFDLGMVSMTIRAILFLIIGSIGVGISRMFFVKK